MALSFISWYEIQCFWIGPPNELHCHPDFYTYGSNLFQVKVTQPFDIYIFGMLSTDFCIYIEWLLCRLSESLCFQHNTNESKKLNLLRQEFLQALGENAYSSYLKWGTISCTAWAQECRWPLCLICMHKFPELHNLNVNLQGKKVKRS